MKIYSMTATFGKLSHETLSFQDGLNVIHAPNEWGKSTWCAFLVAMLYGIDTRERTTQTTLADKERYAPWSGEAMSGRMDICWGGRNITIERSSNKRTPFGEFRAYETQSGLPVTELNANNCGEVLLGVEKSVFTKTGFLRLTDLPVTQDDALRRRLNALVTTGDESGASDDLEQKLRELKNRCRHNKTGLLPQAEAQRDAISGKLTQLQTLQNQSLEIKTRQQDLEEQIKLLENHQAALNYQAAAEGMRRVQDACTARDNAENELNATKAAYQGLPSEETAKDTLEKLDGLQQQWNYLQAEPQPIMPEQVQVPPCFVGISPEQAVAQAKQDFESMQALQKPVSPALLICAGVSLALGVGLSFIKWFLLLPCLALAVTLFVLYQRKGNLQSQDQLVISTRYSGIAPQQWVPMAESYQAAASAYALQYETYKSQLSQLQSRRETLTSQTAALTQGQPLAACISSWEEILTKHEKLQKAQADFIRTKDHAAALEAMAKPAPAPAFEDTLTLTQEQTSRNLADAEAEHRRLNRQYGQCLGQMENLGQEETLNRELSQVCNRIKQLEDTQSALTIAMETLKLASEELQRRFAPRISQRAQDLFARLTGNRYNRLHLTRELNLQAGAEGEDTVRNPLWRSEGTVDQLYLALRLAVAAELTPNAPLVLDDALVRFDDTRLAKALEILKEESKNKQVILFTCQGREENLLDRT